MTNVPDLGRVLVVADVDDASAAAIALTGGIAKAFAARCRRSGGDRASADHPRARINTQRESTVFTPGRWCAGL